MNVVGATKLALSEAEMGSRHAHSLGAAPGVTGFGADGTHQTHDSSELESRANSLSTESCK